MKPSAQHLLDASPPEQSATTPLPKRFHTALNAISCRASKAHSSAVPPTSTASPSHKLINSQLFKKASRNTRTLRSGLLASLRTERSDPTNGAPGLITKTRTLFKKAPAIQVANGKSKLPVCELPPSMNLGPGVRDQIDQENREHREHLFFILYFVALTLPRN